jgi:hypothetical protein
LAHGLTLGTWIGTLGTFVGGTSFLVAQLLVAHFLVAHLELPPYLEQALK